MKRHATLAFLCVLSGTCAVDPCQGVSGSQCVQIDVKGSVGQVDSIRFDFAAAQEGTYLWQVPGGPAALPLGAGVPLPAGVSGTATVSAEALLAGRTVGLGRGTTDTATGHVSLTLSFVSGPTCSDGFRDGTETDIDCGGPCAPCKDGLRCGAARDCQSALCQGGVCPAPSCGDGVKNGKETDVDCGGTCGKCGVDKACVQATDCTDNLCIAGKCRVKGTPVVSTVSPPLGGTVGGTLVAITGQGFMPGATLSVSFGGQVSPEVHYQSPTTITAVTPGQPGKFGGVDVTVKNPGGQSTTLPAAFRYFAPTLDLGLQNSVTVGDRLYSVLVTSLTKDGGPDLVFGHLNGNLLHVMSNKGDGTFQTAVPLTVGQVPYQVIAADFNGDGKPDLCTATFNNAADSSVSVLLGNGDGTFQAAQTSPGGNSPYPLCAGDFDEDGKLDLALGNYFDGKVTVLFGNKDGTLHGPKTFLIPANPSHMEAVDLNGDKHLDLLVTSRDAGSVSVLLGKGDGTFQMAQGFAAGNYPQSLGIGDVNGDGKVDVVTANQNSNDIGVLLGNGDGTFAKVVNYPVGSRPQSIALYDLNGDGVLDVATANHDGDNVSVLLGQGDGSFTLAQTLGYSGCNPYWVAAGDLDHDSRPDLVVVCDGNGASGNQSKIHFNLSR